MITGSTVFTASAYFSLQFCSSHDQPIDGQGHIPGHNQQPPGQDEAANHTAHNKVQGEGGNATAEGPPTGNQPYTHPMQAKGQAAENPEPYIVHTTLWKVLFGSVEHLVTKKKYRNPKITVL